MDDFKISGFNPFELPKESDYTKDIDVKEEEGAKQSAPVQQDGAQQIGNNYDSSKADKDFNVSNINRENALKVKEDAQQALKEAKNPEEIQAAEKAIEQAEKFIEKAELAMGNANSDSLIRKVDGWN